MDDDPGSEWQVLALAIVVIGLTVAFLFVLPGR